MVYSLDTECTGLDLRLVTMTDEENNQLWWEWEVDPLTRQPEMPYEDLTEIQETIDKADLLVLQNAKFDYQALQMAFCGRLRWDWSKVRDTLRAGHLMRSNQPHDLTTMTMVYLGRNIQPWSARLVQMVKEARALAKLRFPEWRLAKAGLPEMPSVKGKPHANDNWLPCAVAKELGYPGDHPWWTVCSDYGRTDADATIHLWQFQEPWLKKEGLWSIYLECLKAIPVAVRMQDKGITTNRGRWGELRDTFKAESEELGQKLTSLATKYNYELKLPKSGNNKSLRDFMLGTEKCPHCTGGYVYHTKTSFESCKHCLASGKVGGLALRSPKSSKKTGAPSLDKEVLEQWEASLPEGDSLEFVKGLLAKRKRDTAVGYLEGYEKFWLPLVRKSGGAWRTWKVLHSSLNPTGTDTLRWSSQHPNQQNFSKQKGFNLRYCLGPAPGREWWSLDAKNIELRIPAYEAGEREMIDLFEREDEPPYYGSYHLLTFDVLHPEKFRKHGVKCKEVYESTWYQWVKNGNFAKQYGAQEATGTADKAYHVPGAQARLTRRFKQLEGLNQRMISQAEKLGYVETMPDKTVDPQRGYPLYCMRTRWGKIKPTIPLSYHVQGTAMWWMMKAMVRVQEYLDRLEGYHLVMQVHDELVFDFPRKVVKCLSCDEDQEHRACCEGCKGVGYKPGNYHIARHVAKLMEKGGDDVGVKTPVGITYHPDDWSEGVTVR
jgi:DNA polymerase I-like protein with 3'-5' exonuclease and polymerase domains